MRAGKRLGRGLGAVAVAVVLVACGDEAGADTEAWADFCPALREVECEGRARALPSCNWPDGPDVPGPCHMEALCWRAGIESACETSSWRTFCGAELPDDPTVIDADACLAELPGSDFTTPTHPRDRVPACAALCD